MKKEIGKRLKQIRESKNLNQTQFGDSLGILYQHVSKYERGETVPTWENLIKLIELYGVNINWLLTGRGKMMLSSMGYAEIEDATSGNKVKDIEDSEIDEIVEELKKDKDLKIIKIEGRAKRYYSLYRKILRKDMDIDKIYDLVALRVITQDIEGCYQVLGIIHQLWPPLKGRIKDYIAQPKPNGYQSLHTSVFGPDGRITEFQIRTQQMHEEAEWGVAAHWSYKENGRQKKRTLAMSKDKMKWIKSLLEEQKKTITAKRYLNVLQLDFFKNRIFALTPKGDVIDLPEGATPIDFAYHIHTDVGHKCAGVKINSGVWCSVPDNDESGFETGLYPLNSSRWVNIYVIDL